MAVQTGGILRHLESGLLVFSIDNLAAGNTTPAIDLGMRAPELSFTVDGAVGTGGSVQLESSNNGTLWTVEGAAITALTGAVQRTTASRFVRFNVTAGDGATLFDLTLVAHPARG